MANCCLIEKRRNGNCKGEKDALDNKLILPYPKALTESVFIERPNRFVIHCRISGTEEVEAVHLPDPGRLKELLIPGKKVWLLNNENPNRKTKWTAVLCEESPGNFVSINTNYPNQLVDKCLRNGVMEEFSGWQYKKAEFTLGRSRWDFLLSDKDGNELLLEVKSVTLVDERKGMFPDAVTARGTKHVKELARLAAESSYKTAVLFVVQREDADLVVPAAHIDPVFAEALKEAEQAGVKLFARTCRVSLDEIALGRPIPVVV